MKTIKNVFNFALSAIVSMFFASCAIQDSNFKASGNTRIQVQTETKMSDGSSHVSTIKSIDGQSIDAEKAGTYVEVKPGRHTVKFSFCKVTDKGGRLTVSLSVFGVGGDIVSPRPAEGIMALSEVEVSGPMKQGGTYWIDTSTLAFTPMHSESLPYSYFGSSGVYALHGTPVIREKQQ